MIYSFRKNHFRFTNNVNRSFFLKNYHRYSLKKQTKNILIYIYNIHMYMKLSNKHLLHFVFHRNYYSGLSISPNNKPSYLFYSNEWRGSLSQKQNIKLGISISINYFHSLWEIWEIYLHIALNLILVKIPDRAYFSWPNPFLDLAYLFTKKRIFYLFENE